MRSAQKHGLVSFSNGASDGKGFDSLASKLK